MTDDVRLFTFMQQVLSTLKTIIRLTDAQRIRISVIEEYLQRRPDYDEVLYGTLLKLYLEDGDAQSQRALQDVLDRLHTLLRDYEGPPQ